MVRITITIDEDGYRFLQTKDLTDSQALRVLQSAQIEEFKILKDILETLNESY